MVLEKVGLNLGKKIIAWTGRSLLTAKPVKINPCSIRYAPKLKQDVFQTFRYTEDEIRKAYNIYAKSPFINSKLRNNEILSLENQKIVNCLLQAIETSQPVRGRFIRGLTGTRTLEINDSTIKKFIFNNKGFTSTAPIENGRYAETFALGKNSAVVEFDLTKPVKGFSANEYEVIFAPNTFTADKFNLIKIAEKYYKITPKNTSPLTNSINKIFAGIIGKFYKTP